MNRTVLVLCLATTASALIIQTKNEEGASEDAASPTCKEGTWRWTKRASSELRETAQPVSKIYYINVEGSDERKEHMQNELKQKAHGVPYARFAAFDAHKVPKEHKSGAFKKIASLYSKGRYTPWLLKTEQREVFAAIHISNYQVMEKILKEDPEGEKSNKVYMVLEDDSVLDRDWQKRVKLALENTPAEWDMLRIGYWGEARCGDKENDHVFAIQPPAKDEKALGSNGHFYSGNTGYLVRPKSIPRILDIMRNSSFASIENVFMYEHRFPDKSDHQILSYAVAPHLMVVQPGGFTFASSHGLGR